VRCKSRLGGQRSSRAKDVLAFKSSSFKPEQPNAPMPRQSYLHFVCEAMSVMPYRRPNASIRISANMPHSWQMTWTVLRALMGVSPSRPQQSDSNAMQLECDGKRRRYRDGKNTSSYSDTYANGSPAPKTSAA